MNAPERISLAHTPTPLQRLATVSDQFGVDVWIKRDDLTGAALSGNKIRKLEFLLAEARDRGADTVITCGGEQSNHCRATALAATRLGMGSVLLLRTRDPASPPPLGGNILLDRLAGAAIRWITHAEYARRAELMAAEADRLRGEGRVPYVIPEGGSNALGAWGYVRACEELAGQLASLPGSPRTTSIVYACGSGGTGAGLILGARMAGLDARGVRVAGVNVCDDRAYFVTTIGGICDEFARRWPKAPRIAADDIDIVDGYVGRGYAQTQPAELERLRDLARTEGIVLDPVYTGKAFAGFIALARSGRYGKDRSLLFVHTGGTPGLFGYPESV